MNVKNRNLHMFFFASMIVLLVTGFMVYAPRNWVEYLGHFSAPVFHYRGLLHRIAALVFIFAALHHLVYISYSREGRWSFRNLFPGWRDLVGPFNHLLGRFGYKKQKESGFYNYNERLEYWLTFVGTVIIIITGVILWIEQYFGNLEQDISLILHFYAAVLALLGSLVWNMTNLHPEFYFYRKEEELPCSREECVQCDTCLAHQAFRDQAWTRCYGDNRTRALDFLRRGITTCEAAYQLVNDGTCLHSCMELGSCAVVCMYGARYMGDDGMLELDDEKCTGCGMCVRECPTQVIKQFSRLFYVQIMCNSRLPKYTSSLNCPTQCRRCMMCMNRCPQDAIHFNGHLPQIDYTKCISCALCSYKCPVDIVFDQLHSERGHAEVSDKCIGCGICAQVCPVDAVYGNPKEIYVVDPQRCIGCGLCARNCKKGAATITWLDELLEKQSAITCE